MMQRRSFAELNAMLLSRIAPLVAALPLPEAMRGHRARDELRFGSKGALAIWVGGARSGRWRDFSADAGGDLLDLIAWARGCTLAEALRWACDWLGVAAGEQPPRAAMRVAERDRAAVQRRQTADGRSRALKVWGRGRPADGSPVETYLRGRGLVLPDPCPALRFVPDLEYWEARGDSPAVMTGCHPAMVAAIQGPDGRLVGVHRTYLRRWPDGRVGKAHLPAAKKVVGTWRGGAIRLVQPPACTSIVALAEGIETGLAVWHAHRFVGKPMPIWSVVAVANFSQVILPAVVRRVVLCGDSDEEDLARRVVDQHIESRPVTTAGRSLARAVGHWRQAGLDVQLAVPSGRKRDWNDVLVQGGRA